MPHFITKRNRNAFAWRWMDGRIQCFDSLLVRFTVERDGMRESKRTESWKMSAAEKRREKGNCAMLKCWVRH